MKIIQIPSVTKGIGNDCVMGEGKKRLQGNNWAINDNNMTREVDRDDTGK